MFLGVSTEHEELCASPQKPTCRIRPWSTRGRTPWDIVGVYRIALKHTIGIAIKCRISSDLSISVVYTSGSSSRSSSVAHLFCTPHRRRVLFVCGAGSGCTFSCTTRRRIHLLRGCRYLTVASRVDPTVTSSQPWYFFDRAYSRKQDVHEPS